MKHYAIVRKTNGSVFAVPNWHPDVVAYIDADSASGAVSRYFAKSRLTR